jgi:hypothetical protein
MKPSKKFEALNIKKLKVRSDVFILKTSETEEFKIMLFLFYFLLDFFPLHCFVHAMLAFHRQIELSVDFF